MDGCSWGHSEWDDPIFCASQPWFQLLEERERNNLIRAEMPGGNLSVKPANVDLSQTAERKTFSKTRARGGRSAFEQAAEDSPETMFPDQARCLTPEVTVWNIACRRLIIGDEKLALQAIWAASAKIAEFIHKLERDLSGNSWNGIDFLVVTISFLLSLCFISILIAF